MNINSTLQFPLKEDAVMALAGACGRRHAQIQIHIQARNGLEKKGNKEQTEQLLTKAATAIYDAFTLSADIRIKRFELEQKVKEYCDELCENMID